MDLVEHLLVLLHLLGMAAIVGSAAFVARGRVTPALVWGARAQIVTGLLLVGLTEMSGEGGLSHAKVGVKLVVALAVAACAEIGNARSKRGDDATSLVTAAGALAVLNAAVATLWQTEGAES